MSTSDIYNYIQINENTSTSGQPTEEQLASAAQEGFQRVINLALHGADYSLPDEAGLVHSLGMEYIHIPVQWEQPTPADFAAFVQAMDNQPGVKTLIHCAANYRVTAFYGLYAQMRLGWTAAQADALRQPIWKDSDYPAWEKFIADIRAG